MAVVTELFRSEDNGTLSFGDYTLAQKAKKGDIQFEGDIYKIKTFKTMTKLDKNGQLIFESVPEAHRLLNPCERMALFGSGNQSPLYQKNDK